MAEIVTITMNPAIDTSTEADRIVPEHKLRCAAPKRDPGGGGINVARVAVRLGADVLAVFICGGETGALLRRLIDAEGLASLSVHVAGDTREDFTVADKRTGEQYRFVLPGPRLSQAELRSCLETLGSSGGRPAYIVASGSLPPGVPDDFYASAVRTAKAGGAKFVLDTSGASLKAALEEGVFLVKPNLRELSDMAGETLDGESSWVEAARKLVGSGRAEIVALSLGHRGALLVCADGAWRAEPLNVEIVSAVGAGDSFLGAMVWSLASGHSLDKAFRYGVAAGSAALLTPGTDLARAEDVKRLFDDVQMKQL